MKVIFMVSIFYIWVTEDNQRSESLEDNNLAMWKLSLIWFILINSLKSSNLKFIVSYNI